MRTFTWLGANLAPGTFVEFCSDALVKRVAGIPPNKQVNAPVKCRDGPITVPDATPVTTPALSPLVIGIMVSRLCAGAHINNTLKTGFAAIGPAAILGYGVGIGDGAAGVRQTSGKPVSAPPN
jgi:hypothetical protein